MKKIFSTLIALCVAANLFIGMTYAQEDVAVSENDNYNFTTETTKFYVEEDKICAMDLATGEVTVIDSEEETEYNEVDYTIYNVYKDKYLYYGRYDKVVFHDLVIYDLEEGKEVFFYENISRVDIIGDKIYMDSDTSQVVPSNVYEANPDGSDMKTITESCFSTYKIFDGNLYYADFNNVDYYNPTSEVKKYNTATGVTETLTPRLDGCARIMDKEYATFGDLYGNYATDVYFTEESDKELNVELDGEVLTFDQTPIMVNDRVMVPIRVIFEALGYTLEWDGETETAIATNGDKKIYTTVGDCNIKYNDGVYAADVAPVNVSGRVLVPIRAISETAGCTVDWIGETKTVTIAK